MRQFKTDTKHAHIEPKSINRNSLTYKYLLIAYEMVKNDSIPEKIIRKRSFRRHYEKYKKSLFENNSQHSENPYSIHPCARILDREISKELNDFPKHVGLAEILVKELDKINWPIN